MCVCVCVTRTRVYGKIEKERNIHLYVYSKCTRVLVMAYSWVVPFERVEQRLNAQLALISEK